MTTHEAAGFLIRAAEEDPRFICAIADNAKFEIVLNINNGPVTITGQVTGAK